MKKIVTILFVLSTLSIKAQNAIDSTISNFINEWIGKPYRFGGKTKRGIDCSALVQTFYNAIFGIAIPRTCSYQFKQSQRVELNEIKIGDILFFKSRLSPSGWHCGVFIGEDRFFHAANRKEGVKISYITDENYAKHLKGIGRFTQQ